MLLGEPVRAKSQLQPSSYQKSLHFAEALCTHKDLLSYITWQKQSLCLSGCRLSYFPHQLKTMMKADLYLLVLWFGGVLWGFFSHTVGFGNNKDSFPCSPSRIPQSGFHLRDVVFSKD